MRRLALCLSLPLLTGLAAQDPAPRPTRSLAAGLVRQQIEVDRLRPPTAQQGLEIGAGEGPLVLLVWRAGSALTLSELQRGDGDHGHSPEPRRIDLPREEKVVEPPPPPPGEAAKASAAQPAKVALALTGDELVATSSGASLPTGECSRGKQQLDAKTLRPRLEAMLAAGKDQPHAALLQVDAAADVPMQHVLTLWEMARSVGFTGIAFEGGLSKRTLPTPAREQIEGLAKRFEWPTRQIADGVITLCEGELLIALDGPATYGDMVPLMTQLARAGIWRFGFVAKQDAKTYVKLPTNLPFDRGL